ncbi:MAG TPA: hypothetical protein VHY08_06120, partial [Bacillota bacterium]|nr:hypothetical protein [Bacillota bacterium]
AEETEKVKKVKDDHENNLLTKANVTGVDIGYKYVNGEKTDKVAIRVFVEKKEDVSEKDFIPKEIDGIATDVIETQKIELQVLKIPVDEPILQTETRRFDPLIGGIEIGPCRAINGYLLLGTLGAIVQKEGKKYALSNFHVMGADSNWRKGDELVQPSRANGGYCPENVIGKLNDACLTQKYGNIQMQADAAISTITNRSISGEILGIGEIKGSSLPVIGKKVRKHGRTTNLTFGSIDGIHATVTLDYGEGIGRVTLRNQISIIPDKRKNTAFSKSGDSGSVIVDENNNVVGLLFAGAGNNSRTYANIFSEVEQALNISLLSESLIPV